MDNAISPAALQRLIGVGKPALTELVVRGIVQRGDQGAARAYPEHRR